MEPEAEHTWIVVTDEWFDQPSPNPLHPEGVEISLTDRTVRCAFGPVGVVGSRICVRRGVALYVEKPGSGQYRLERDDG